MSAVVAVEQPAESLPTLSAAVELNPRQISFIHHYLDVRVGWKAAQLAGYSGDENALAVMASNLLRNVKVIAYYNERLQSLQVTSDEVLAELGGLARYPVSEMGEKCVVRPADKLKALELAGKYHKLFTDKTETELAPGDVDRISDAVIAGLYEAAQRRQQASQAELSSQPLALADGSDNQTNHNP